MKSVVDEGASSLLIDSALRVIFRRLDLVLTQYNELSQTKSSAILRMYDKECEEEGDKILESILNCTITEP